MRFPFEKYRYYHSDNQVVAVSTFAGKSVRGIAKCNPHDQFSMENGKKLAALRCNNKITAKRLKRAAMRYVEAGKAAAAAQDKLKRMEQYYHDAKAENDDAVNELNDLMKHI